MFGYMSDRHSKLARIIYAPQKIIIYYFQKSSVISRDLKKKIAYVGLPKGIKTKCRY